MLGEALNVHVPELDEDGEGAGVVVAGTSFGAPGVLAPPDDEEEFCVSPGVPGCCAGVVTVCTVGGGGDTVMPPAQINNPSLARV